MQRCYPESLFAAVNISHQRQDFYSPLQCFITLSCLASGRLHASVAGPVHIAGYIPGIIGGLAIMLMSI